jgi:hypothetical protein
MTCRNFQVFRVLGCILRIKAQVDSRSRGQNILFVEKRRERLHHARGPGNRWSHGSGWKLGFCNLFILPESGVVSQVQTEVSWEGEVSLLGQLPPFGTSCSPSFKLAAEVTQRLVPEDSY